MVCSFAKEMMYDNVIKARYVYADDFPVTKKDIALTKIVVSMTVR
jgi:hypothetical protein